jgi:hypothetical protein
MTNPTPRRSTIVVAASTVPVIPVINRTTGQVVKPADCTFACVNANSPRSSCSHDCPDHGAAHRRVAKPAAADPFARLPVVDNDEW